MCFQSIIGWHTLEICNCIIPRSNGVGEYGIRVSRGLIPYFTKCIGIINSMEGYQGRVVLFSIL